MKNIKKFMTIFCLLILSSCANNSFIVTITNPTSEERLYENVEVDWHEIKSRVPEITPDELVVMCDGKEQVYQVIYSDKTPSSVLIQPSVPSNDAVMYEFREGVPTTFDTLTFGRIVPERKDDFAWENNRVAYRVYGPALAATGELSNGIDVWAKRTDKMVIDKWYKLDDYHRDHGEGLDYYKVGRTLGAGAVAPILDSMLVLGDNFIRAELFENGPLRTTFKLYYAPLKVGDVEVVESRIISLSANSHFNKISVAFDGDFSSIPVASGIVMRKDLSEIYVDNELGFISYQEPKVGINGELAISVILADEFRGAKEQEGHILAFAEMSHCKILTYYMGNSWSKAGFETAQQWVEYTKSYVAALKDPLILSY